MNDILSQLQLHMKTHPALELSDAIKFLYQGCMGNGHLMLDREAAWNYLVEEWQETPVCHTAPLTESLGNGLCRLSLAGCKELGLSVHTLFALFLRANQLFSPSQATLKTLLPQLCSLFPHTDQIADIQRYLQAGMPMVSHSQTYRDTYTPAYRLVLEQDISLLPLCAAIDRHMAQNPRTIVALDGPCAAGKSTIGALLSQLYGCPLVHMDDFFLPQTQKTPARLSQAGGNIDAERFLTQVLLPVSCGKPAKYQPYHCHTDDFGEWLEVPPSALTIIEGVYALRPDLQPYYSICCYIDAPWTIRRERLLKRCGEDGLARFEALWIPLEQQYFETFQIESHCPIKIKACF